MIQLPGIIDLPLVIIFVALMGLANTLCWPAIWPMTLKDIGGYTKIGSALLIMGIIGGTIYLSIYGYLAGAINSSNVVQGISDTAKSGNQIAYLILLPAYFMIIF